MSSTLQRNAPITSSTLMKAIPWIMCILGAAFYCYESLLRVSPSVMNTDLMLHYHINAAQLGHLIAFYYYIYAPMQIGVGIMMDRFGPHRLLTMACAACAVGTYFFVSSDHLFLAELGRFLVGFGSSFAFVGVLKLATIWLPPERFAVISGSTMALGMVGGMLGDVTLTALVDHEGWRTASYQASVFGIGLAFILLLFLRDGSKTHKMAQDSNLTFQVVLKNLRALVFNRQIWINGLIGGLMWLPLSVFAETWGIFYLKQVYGFTSINAASANSMIFMGWAVGGPLVGMISDRLRQRRLPMTVGSAIAALLISVILYVPSLQHSTIYLLLFLFGLFSSVQVIIFAVAREISSTRAAGTAIALTNMFVMASGIVQPISGVILEHVDKSIKVMENGAHIFTVNAYQTALGILPAGLMLAMFLSFFLKETHCKESELDPSQVQEKRADN